ncbi:MAG: hypothetical protein M3004_09305 [Bacteroidota bacterium]|nr:hypothetical protein [Bacteroidota bacterium]
MRQIIFAILISSVFMFFISCKKETPFNNISVNPPPPPSSSVAGFWNEDPYHFGDGLGYYPAGFVNISIDGGALITLYYTLPPTGPTDCNTIGVMKIPVSIGQHSWQAFSLNTNSLVRSGTFTITSQLCQLVKIF